MSFDADNGENIAKNVKPSEDFKSPGRRAAEERAERIRYAEEYRRKLEEQKAPLQPKKTKAAEQKELEKLERLAREQAEKAAQLERQRQESERRIYEAKDKLNFLGESIEKAEAAARTVETKYAEKTVITESAKPVKSAKRVAPVKLKNLTIHIPVQSFNFPCAVKKRKTVVKQSECGAVKQANAEQSGQYWQYTHPAFCSVQWPMMQYPMCFVPAEPAFEPGIAVSEGVSDKVREPQAKEIQQVELAAPLQVKPSVCSTVKNISDPEPLNVTLTCANPTSKAECGNCNDVKDNPIFRPAITYGVSVSEGGWEHEIEEEDDIIIESANFTLTHEDVSQTGVEDVDASLNEGEESGCVEANGENDSSVSPAAKTVPVSLNVGKQTPGSADSSKNVQPTEVKPSGEEKAENRSMDADAVKACGESGVLTEENDVSSQAVVSRSKK